MEAPMNKPESRFVLDKIKGLAFTNSNREYVEKLLMIERYTLQRPMSFAEGMHSQQLERTYPVEWDAIHRELDPDGYEARQQARATREREAREEERKLAAAARLLEAKDRALWEQLGGKVNT
jgi:hypothetical protein